MKAFTVHQGLVAALDRPNVDTDAIIPKQYLKSIRRSGFGPFLFDGWRYLDPGDLEVPVESRRVNPEFVLNQPEYAGASILLARENFGCGSSREHAVWALDDFGFRVVVAPSFADIFFSNSFKNGLLAVVLDTAAVGQLFAEQAATPGYRLTVDLAAQELRSPSGAVFGFDIDPFRKDCLLRGLDEIGLTLQSAGRIRAYEANRRERAPWLFAAV